MMKVQSAIARIMQRITQQEDINFILTNRIPRQFATRFMGWFSKIQNPLIRDVSIGVWRLFSDLDLSEASEQRFRSLHDCFVRRLKDGARPIDTDHAYIVSPCDAIVGASGRLQGTELLQIKGSTYQLGDLLADDALTEIYRDGSYVTLRLTSSMYHHFHAPYDCQVESVTYISGDTWNVNSIALKRVARLFCKNERAVIRTKLSNTGYPITLVPVAAILVASIRFTFLDTDFDLRSGGPRTITVNKPASKGQEMGWFQHGSTIIVFAPKGFDLAQTVQEGVNIRVGQPLMHIPCIEPTVTSP
jgi:phosphatidylserine decarboxylase